MADCRECELNDHCPGFSDCPKMPPIKYSKQDVKSLVDHLRSYTEGIYVKKYAWLIDFLLYCLETGMVEESFSPKASEEFKGLYPEAWYVLMITSNPEDYLKDESMAKPIAEWRIKTKRERP